MNVVSYEKCKDCEHYGVWSERCWNVYECPKDTADYIPYSIRKLYAHANANEKEVKINAENESLSKAERKEILSKLSYIKYRCTYNIGDDYDTRESIYNTVNEIIRIIKHKE